MRISLLVIPTFALSSCVLFDPYIHTTGSRVSNAASTKQLSYDLRRELEVSASAQSWYSKSSSTVLAALLGLGAYKGVTGGGGHQIAALAAGAGVTYGLHEVMYTPSREQIYLGAVDSLLCLDRIYDGFDPSVGEKLATNYRDRAGWTAYAPTYYHYLSVAQRYDAQYRQRVLLVPSAVNQRLSAQQLTAGQSYALLSKAIIVHSPPPPANKAMGAPGDGTVHQFSDLDDWGQQVMQRAKDFTDDQCKGGGALAPTIVLADGNDLRTLQVSGKEQLPMQNTSGILSTSVTPKDASDSAAVESKIVSEKGAYWLEISAKTATKQPVRVEVTDYGRSGASDGVWVEVK